jgi:hypothetical protein
MDELGMPVTRDQHDAAQRPQRHRFSVCRRPKLDELCERQRVCRGERNSTLTAQQLVALCGLQGATAVGSDHNRLDTSSQARHWPGSHFGAANPCHAFLRSGTDRAG